MATDRLPRPGYFIEPLAGTFERFIENKNPQKKTVDAQLFFAATRDSIGRFKRAYYEPHPLNHKAPFVEKSSLMFSTFEFVGGRSEKEIRINIEPDEITPGVTMLVREYGIDIMPKGQLYYFKTVYGQDGQFLCAGSDGLMPFKYIPGRGDILGESKIKFESNDKEVLAQYPNACKVTIPRQINPGRILKSLIAVQILENPLEAPTSFDQSWRSADVPALAGFVIPAKF